MDIKIALYDADGNKIGETFKRRAKQLVKQQRAVWEDESQTSIRFLPDEDNFFEEVEEEKESTKNALIMYKAKQNVKERKNIIKHAIAYFITWIMFSIIYWEMIHPTLNTRAHLGWRFDSAIRALNGFWDSIVFEFREDNIFGELWRLDEAINHLENVSVNAPAEIWLVFVGAMLFWGGLIIYRLGKIIKVYYRNKPRKKHKPDPIEVEYKRLMEFE